jgi:hypothetical protein
VSERGLLTYGEHVCVKGHEESGRASATEMNCWARLIHGCGEWGAKFNREERDVREYIDQGIKHRRFGSVGWMFLDLCNLPFVI